MLCMEYTPQHTHTHLRAILHRLPSIYAAYFNNFHLCLLWALTRVAYPHHPRPLPSEKTQTISSPRANTCTHPNSGLSFTLQYITGCDDGRRRRRVRKMSPAVTPAAGESTKRTHLPLSVQRSHRTVKGLSTNFMRHISKKERLTK